MLFGLAVGITTGVALGLGVSGDNCFCPPTHEAVIVGGGVLGGAGLVLGGLLGALIGSHDVYQLDASYAPRISTAVAPGQASAGLTWSF